MVNSLIGVYLLKKMVYKQYNDLNLTFNYLPTYCFGLNRIGNDCL